MLCLSGFELYSRWVPLLIVKVYPAYIHTYIINSFIPIGNLHYEFT